MAATGTINGNIGSGHPVFSRVQDYWQLTKPRITLLVLVTTFAGMWLAQGGMPDVQLVFLTLLGTGLAAGSSSTLNNFVDREVDRFMARTNHRALPTGRVTGGEALALGIFLGAGSFVLLSWAVNLLTAVLAVSTILFYVLIYTVWLKRTTPLCTSIGGIAGAAPPLIGWAAVTGEIGIPAWILFGVMFIWQPPHFWALGLIRESEYRRAKLPILPVARGEAVTRRHMLAWNLALVPAVALVYAAGVAGDAYLVLATAMTAYYLFRTVQFVRQPVTVPAARRMFLASVLYLAALMCVVMVDAGPGRWVIGI